MSVIASLREGAAEAGVEEIRRILRLGVGPRFSREVEILALHDPTRDTELVVPPQLVEQLGIERQTKERIVWEDGKVDEWDLKEKHGSSCYGFVRVETCGDDCSLLVFVDQNLREPVMGKKGIEKVYGVLLGSDPTILVAVGVAVLGLIWFLGSITQIREGYQEVDTTLPEGAGHGRRAMAWYVAAAGLLPLVNVAFAILGLVMFVWGTVLLVRTLRENRRLRTRWVELLAQWRSGPE